MEPNKFNHSAQAVTNTPIRDARYNAPNSTMAMMIRGSIPAAFLKPLCSRPLVAGGPEITSRSGYLSPVAV